MGLGSRAAVLAAVGFGMGGLSGFADDAETNRRIDTLQRELDELRAKVGASAQPLPESVGGPVEVADKLKLSGFLDVGYNVNLARPRNVPAVGVFEKLNSGRVFDNRANDFILHALEIDLEVPTGDPGSWGFRGDVAYGRDPQVYRSGGSGFDTDAFGGVVELVDLQQAFVKYQATKELSIIAGKYVTLAGAEVIESKDNWNYSRSFMFGLSIPFAHTGARASYQATDTVCLHFGINNGWDNLIDGNHGKTVELGAMATLVNSEQFGLAYAGAIYWGPEGGMTGTGAGAPGIGSGDKRWVFSNVLTAGTLPVPGLSLMLNIDFGAQDEAVGKLTGTGNEDASWSGWALYGKYKVEEKLALILRLEQFNDDDAFRTGIRAAGPPKVDDLTLRGLTLTLQYDAAANVITRLEFRHDESSEDFFFDGTSSIQNMKTFGAEVIYSF